jgi:hypothetical protein
MPERGPIMSYKSIFPSGEFPQRTVSCPASRSLGISSRYLGIMPSFGHSPVGLTDRFISTVPKEVSAPYESIVGLLKTIREFFLKQGRHILW